MATKPDDKPQAAAKAPKEPILFTFTPVKPGDHLRSVPQRDLTAEDVAAGYALACQTVVEGDVRIVVPPQEKIERRLTTDRTAVEVTVPAGYDPDHVQTIRRVALTLPPPSLDDQTDDWARIQRGLRQHADLAEVGLSLAQMQRMGTVLRESDWQVTAILDAAAWDCPDCPARLIDLLRSGSTSEAVPAALSIRHST